MKKIKTKFNRNLIITAIIVIALLVIVQTSPQVACTEEARLCPDGSAVGRVPPNCEFASCPPESCEIDSDCVGAECCHPTYCINKAYKEDCSNVGCSAVCEGPLDCGAGTCGCVNNRCIVIPR